MLKKIKSLVIVALALGGLVGTPGISLAAVDCSSGSLTIQQAIQCGTDSASGNSTQTPADSAKNINDTIASILQVLSAVAGIAAVVMLIIGGIRYVTSAGKQESVASAKNTILYAVIGLVIVALAQIIVYFVLNKATGTPSSNNTANSSNSGSSNKSGGLTGGSTNPGDGGLRGSSP